ncbi:hypothetical protein ACIP2X_25595 [Streptomyces sp. NPDC089424]|uniref:hypothetical protein n=1 Tax=Streptomyces sp. NPDC089424 TaxID=3365917 RepID=UPI003802BEB4
MDRRRRAEHPQGRPFPLEDFTEALALAEAPARDAKPVFVLDDDDGGRAGGEG